MLGFDTCQDPFDVGLHERPCALVFGLFLTPDHLGVFEPFKFVQRRLCGERIELFIAHEVDVRDATRVAFFQQVKVDLARTHHDPFDFVVSHQFGVRVAVLRIVPKDAVEGRSRLEFFRLWTPPFCGAARILASS